MVAAITVTRRDVPPPPPEKTRRTGPDSGDLSRRRVRRRSAQASTGTPPGNWRRGDGWGWNSVRRGAGVRRRTSQAEALAEARSGQRSFNGSAYVQAPPSGASCATRSRGTATWSPRSVAAAGRARNLEGGGAGGALVEGLSRARPEGARVASRACVMPVASLILRLAPAVDCLLASLKFCVLSPALRPPTCKGRRI